MYSMKIFIHGGDAHEGTYHPYMAARVSSEEPLTWEHITGYLAMVIKTVAPEEPEPQCTIIVCRENPEFGMFDVIDAAHVSLRYLAKQGELDV